MRSPRQAARATIANLVTLVSHGGWDAVAGSLGLLSWTGSAQRDRLRHILIELVELTAEMLQAKATALGSSGIFEMDLRRPDNSVVEIDTLDPPLRATMRALLAQVNGRSMDTADQVDRVLFGGQRAATESILVTLRWATSMLDWCRYNEVAAPDWLERADGAA